MALQNVKIRLKLVAFRFFLFFAVYFIKIWGVQLYEYINFAVLCYRNKSLKHNLGSCRQKCFHIDILRLMFFTQRNVYDSKK